MANVTLEMLRLLMLNQNFLIVKFSVAVPEDAMKGCEKGVIIASPYKKHTSTMVWRASSSFFPFSSNVCKQTALTAVH